jgi:hypothetical protein
LFRQLTTFGYSVANDRSKTAAACRRIATVSMRRRRGYAEDCKIIKSHRDDQSRV